MYNIGLMLQAFIHTTNIGTHAENNAALKPTLENYHVLGTPLHYIKLVVIVPLNDGENNIELKLNVEKYHAP